MNPTAYRYQACFWSSDSHLWLQLRKKGPVCQGFANWNDRQGHENRRIPAAVYGRGWKVFNENMRRPVKFWGLRFPRSAPLQKKKGSLKSSIFLLGFSINHPPILTLEPIQVVICSRIPELPSGLEIWGSALVWWSSKMKTSTFLGLFTEKCYRTRQEQVENWIPILE